MTLDATQIPDGWQAVRLGDVSALRREQVKPAEGDPRPYIALENIDSGGVLNDYGAAGESISNKTVFLRGDTLYGKLRPNLRKVIRADFDGVCSTDILAVYTREGLDGSFLTQLLRSDLLHEHAMRGVAGTKMPRTSWKHLERFTYSLPPLPEQRAIAAVLDGIDEAIERTEEVIAATERLRDALLHELLTRGLPGRHSEWVDVPGLGTVPACWDVVRLGEVCEVTSGFAIGPKRAPRDHPRRYLTVANVRADHVTVGELRYMELTDAEHASRSLRAGDLVVVEGHAQISQLGRAAIVPAEAEGFTFQNHLFRVRLLDNGDLRFVAASINGPRGRAYFASFGGTTSGLNTVSARNVRLLPVPWPSGTEQQAITAALTGVADSVERAREERAQLQSLQASAADALLTGHVRASPMED